MLPGREQGEGDFNRQTQPQPLQKALPLHTKPGPSVRGSGATSIAL